MSAGVSGLEEAGLVKRNVDPSDGRQSIVSLTSAARDLIRAYRAARDDWLYQAIVNRLTPGEQKELEKSLEILKRLSDT